MGIRCGSLPVLNPQSITHLHSIIMLLRFSGLLAILSSTPFALASNYAYPPFTAGATYSGGGWTNFCFDNAAAACWDGCASLLAYSGSASQTYTYTFAVPSTHFFWYGFKDSLTGSAKVCFDGATTGCDTVSFYSSTANFGSDPAVLLYSKSGLSNAIHTVTITNLADNNGRFGRLNIDHMELDGGVPHFPSDTFVATSPVMLQQYRIALTYGATAEPSVGRALTPLHEVVPDII